MLKEHKCTVREKDKYGSYPEYDEQRKQWKYLTCEDFYDSEEIFYCPFCGVKLDA